jgi:misacylated tRNA(Ala) deacylase
MRSIYLEDSYCFHTEARIVAVQEDRIALDRTCFYPGGGGQPRDEGFILLAGNVRREIAGIESDEAGLAWHVLRDKAGPEPGAENAVVIINAARRLITMRSHTALHILNALVYTAWGGLITGAQIGAEHSRIDFTLKDLSPGLCAELEAAANRIVREDRAVSACCISPEEYGRRKDLRRTLRAAPPVAEGRVRVVEIAGFDAQACGGTHVARTAEIGKVTITRTENKGRLNKRIYIRLSGAPPESGAA